MTASNALPPGHKRGRSPGYPGIGLRDALDKAQVLLDREGTNPVPLDSALDHWGYRPGSGPGNTAVSALRKFGLVTYAGKSDDRRVVLTDRARRILLSEPGDADRDTHLREAALSPRIFEILWAEHQEHGMPSDASLARTLQRDYAFTKAGAAECVASYRDTLEFAGFLESEAVLPDAPATAREQMPLTSPPRAIPGVPAQRQPVSFVIPITHTKRVIFEGSPFTREEMARFEALIGVYRDELVTPDKEPAD